MENKLTLMPPPPPPPRIDPDGGRPEPPQAPKTPPATSGGAGAARWTGGRGRNAHGHAVTGRAPAPFRRGITLRHPCPRRLDLDPSRPRRMPPCTETMARSRGRGRHGFRGRPGRPSIGPFPRAGPAPGRPRRGGRNPWPVTAGGAVIGPGAGEARCEAAGPGRRLGRGWAWRRRTVGGRGSPVRGARSRTAPGTWGAWRRRWGAWRRRKGGFGWPGSWRRGLVCTRRRLAPETLPPGLAGSWRCGLVCAVSCVRGAAWRRRRCRPVSREAGAAVSCARSRAREGGLVPGKAVSCPGRQGRPRRPAPRSRVCGPVGYTHKYDPITIVSVPCVRDAARGAAKRR